MEECPLIVLAELFERMEDVGSTGCCSVGGGRALLEGGRYDDEVRVAGMVESTVCDMDLACIAVAMGAGPAHGDVEELLYMLKNEEGDFLTVEGRCLPELCQAVVRVEDGLGEEVAYGGELKEKRSALHEFKLVLVTTGALVFL